MYHSVSVIVPAFNEAQRLPAYLEALRRHLPVQVSDHDEVIVVDDGSGDETAAVIVRQAVTWSVLTLLRHSANRGKGQALRTGVAAARGDTILVADADGATSITEEAKLRQAILDGADIAIGSRMLGANGVQRSWLRNFTGAGFAWAVQRMFDLPFRDTQCGFKMFRREVAERVFGMCREDGFLIDIEVLLHAHRLGYKIAEVPVQWRDVPGSKVRLFRDGWRMLTGLWRLRRRMRENHITTETPRHREAKAERELLTTGANRS